MEKKTALIVGGSSGIGCEVCRRLAGLGWKVYNLSRTACKYPKITNVETDVSAEGELEEAIAFAGRKNGLDLLVYSAGFSMAAPVEHAKEEDYRYLFEVNFFGALRAMQTAIPLMKERGGKIILVGSLGGNIPIVFDAFYSASKAALEMLARAAYAELSPYDISVTAFLPGGTSTGFTFKRKVYTDDGNGSYAKNVNCAVAALADMEQKGMSPSSVAEDVLKVIYSDKPPVVKTSGVKNTAYRIMSRVMPEKLTLYLNNRMYGQ